MALLGAEGHGIGSVSVDNVGAGRDAARHLLNLGHERIAFIGIRDEENSNFGGVPPLQRLIGYREALESGVSEWTVEEIRAGAALASELGIQLVSSQPQYNMLWRVIEAEVVPVCEELGITQVCWSPLAQGALTGKYDGGRSVPSSSRFTSEDGALKTEHKFIQPLVLERVEKLKPIAEDLGVPLATLAVAWVLANPNVSAAIGGASRRDPAKVESFPERV
ncbi:aldo/keto reductase [Arthrobacter sp. MMS18-M83]|uniref:aldo/keto reductase n=1 Tax=Arthrobacter sp. MMS18-M83 TaxID=2996261 RepID=UPI00227CE248|nr:aldo/keto reductase [Arthrobacter sp. MMS18-M83]WAH98099.1 aldo/keto reductase [Arthrobacter sp. MMS18-M83]